MVQVQRQAKRHVQGVLRWAGTAHICTAVPVGCEWCVGHAHTRIPLLWESRLRCCRWTMHKPSAKASHKPAAKLPIRPSDPLDIPSTGSQQRHAENKGQRTARRKLKTTKQAFTTSQTKSAYALIAVVRGMPPHLGNIDHIPWPLGCTEGMFHTLHFVGAWAPWRVLLCSALSSCAIGRAQGKEEQLRGHEVRRHGDSVLGTVQEPKCRILACMKRQARSRTAHRADPPDVVRSCGRWKR